MTENKKTKTRGTRFIQTPIQESTYNYFVEQSQKQNLMVSDLMGAVLDQYVEEKRIDERN